MRSFLFLLPSPLWGGSSIPLLLEHVYFACDTSQAATANAVGVAIAKADHLQAERHGVDFDSGSDSAGTPSSDAGTANSGLPVDESPSGAPPGAASVMQASQLAASAAWMARIRSRSFRSARCSAERQILVCLRTLEDIAAQLADIAIAHRAEEPAGLPAVATVRQLRNGRKLGFQRRDPWSSFVFGCGSRRGRLQPHRAFVEFALWRRRMRRPSRQFRAWRDAAASRPAHLGPVLASPGVPASPPTRAAIS